MATQSTAKANSQRKWLNDLDSMRLQAKHRFPDVAWSTADSVKVVHAHKWMVYVRATGSFQQRYLGVPHNMSHSDLSLFGRSSTSFRTFTPSSVHHGDSLTPTPYDPYITPRPSSSTDHSRASDVNLAPAKPLPLGGTDINVFESALEYFYTGSEETETFAVLLDGFKDDNQHEGKPMTAAAKLQQDMLYLLNSHLYSDVVLRVEGSGTQYRAHRAILASRCPYFHSLLLGDYRDSEQTEFTLPSPPFSAASARFVLIYIYTGSFDQTITPRQFDLSIAFEMWRCAAFLGMNTLQSEMEDKIISMSSPSRAARIYAFAHNPDVSNPRLAKAIEPQLLDGLEEVWASPSIGNLAFEVQQQLVRKAIAAVKPLTLVQMAKKVAGLRRKLEAERATWADHIRSMLESIEDKLESELAAELPAVIASPGFVDLIDGVGFSTDVLEWLLTLVVKGLTEVKAPESYQVLVGSVLLREEGILADVRSAAVFAKKTCSPAFPQARILVEDVKNGILHYIKRKWNNIRGAGGFDHLEGWCLKELADELEKTTEELVEGPRLRPSPPRARQPPRRLLEGTPPTMRKRPAEPMIATASEKRLPPSTSKASLSSSAPASGPAAVRVPRVPRLSNASVASRATAASVATTRTARTSGPTASSTTTPSPPNSRTVPGARTPLTATRPPAPSSAPRPPPAATFPSAAVSSPAPSTRSVASATPPTRLPPPVPAVPSIRQRATSAPRVPPGAAARPAQRAVTPSPSVTSRRSVASTATIRTTAPTRTTPRPPPAGSTRREPSAARSAPSRKPSPSPSNAVPRLRERSSASSIKSTPSVASAASSLRRPPSASTLASTAKRPPSVASIASRRPPVPSTSSSSSASPAPATPSSSAPTTSTSRNPLPASTSKRSIRSSTSVSTVTGAAKIRAPPLPTTNKTPALAKASTPSKFPSAAPATADSYGPLPGTTLLSGIPCIVTVRCDRPMRIKAMVRYIGQLIGESGQWVGVEAFESAIPAEAGGLGWNDGEKDGVVYFKLQPASSPKVTPPNSSSSKLAPPVSGSSSDASASSTSLRPPSRRAVRRSSSNEATENGPRKGLFVRPDQILYVM
ncbi:hypothetical protein JCM11641_004711 [Rhodosporidiobolus odoratus]